MTTRHDIDRELRVYLDGRSVSRAPSGLLEAALQGVDATRQRPGWLASTIQPWARLAAAMPPRRAMVLVVVVIVLALAFVAALVASHRRVPPPFGLARPGVLAFDTGGDIWASNPDGSQVARLTSGPGVKSRATFSPDGTRIAYAWPRDDLSLSVVVINADGTHPVHVVDGLAEVGDLAWSPDGTRLAFAARQDSGSGDWHVMIARSDGSGSGWLGDAGMLGEDPAWSPDGARVAFTREWPCCGAAERLWIVDVDGTNGHAVSTPVAPWGTAWSPDGRTLAFLGQGVGGEFDVYLMDVDGSAVRNITHSEQNESTVSWSPDGARLAYTRDWSQYGQQSSLYVVDADGTTSTPLDGPFVTATRAVWSPDATRLLGFAFADPYMIGHSDEPTQVVAFDPSNRMSPAPIGIPKVHTASWQRLAP
jgi:Tol biopolymer transport system component